MKKVLILCFTLFVACYLKADEHSLLNPEIGRKYTVETIYHLDTSKTNLRREYDKRIYEWTAINYDLKGKSYTVKLSVSYFMHVVQEINQTGEWQEKEVYETGYLTSYRNPLAFINRYHIPVTFKLSKDGKATIFDFSEYGKAKKPGSLDPDLGELDQKDIESEIGVLFADTNSTLDTQQTINTNFHSFFSNLPHRISWENKSKETNEVDTDSKEHAYRKLVVDKSTGLILEKVLSNLRDRSGQRNLTYYQKMIPDFSKKGESKERTEKGTYEKSEMQNVNTALRITNHDPAIDPKFIYLTWFDQFSGDFKSAQLERDEHGIFNFQSHLDQSQGYYINFSAELPNITNPLNLNLNPGDDLDVDINNSGENTFSGVGADENRVSRQIGKLILSETKELKARPFQPVKASLDSAYRILNESKSTICPETYLDLSNTLLYLTEIMKTHNDTTYTDKLKFPVCNTIAKNNSYYQLFLKSYVASFMQKISHSSTNLFSSAEPYEREYSFGQVLFPEPILTEYLSRVVENAIERGRWENAKILYDRHKLNYLNNPRLLKTYRIYQLQTQLSPGLLFPLKELTDIWGKTIKFREITDKLIIIRVYQIQNIGNLAKEIANFKRTSTHQQKINEVWLFIGRNNQLSDLQAIADSLPEIRIVFKRMADLLKNDNMLRTLSTRRVFVLGRKGVIIFNRIPDAAELQIAVADLSRPHLLSASSDFTLKIIALTLLVTLILTGIGFIIYRRISGQKLKQADLNRRMRELELTVIRTQMNPHFMYNCLNSIQNLVQKNQNEEAHLYLSKFASLVRQVLNNSKKEEIALSNELDSVSAYIELEQLRFGFDYAIELQKGIDPNDIFVPPMLLQPFVENAILHGLLLKKSDRMLKVQILKIHNKIVLVIEDNGVGREAATKLDHKGNGQGIRLCQDRLLLLSEKTGIQYELKIEDLANAENHPSGTRVSIGFIEEE